MIESGYHPPEEESEDPREYEKPDEKPSFDKSSHKDRSLGNDDRKGGHQKHWKDVKKDGE